MVEGRPDRCQTVSPCGGGDLPGGRTGVQTAASLATARYVTVSTLIWTLVAAGVVTVLIVLARQAGPKRRARAVRELLDAADALEARLRTARAEIEAVTGPQGTDPVGEALREMLRQRLWLRDHGREATLEQ